LSLLYVVAEKTFSYGNLPDGGIIMDVNLVVSSSRLLIEPDDVVDIALLLLLSLLLSLFFSSGNRAISIPRPPSSLATF
jgi:hypothetical protein